MRKKENAFRTYKATNESLLPGFFGSSNRLKSRDIFVWLPYIVNGIWHFDSTNIGYIFAIAGISCLRFHYWSACLRKLLQYRREVSLAPERALTLQTGWNWLCLTSFPLCCFKMKAFEDIIVSVLELGTDYRGLLCKLRQTFAGTDITRAVGGEVNFCDVANIYICKLLEEVQQVWDEWTINASSLLW